MYKYFTVHRQKIYLRQQIRTHRGVDGVSRRVDIAAKPFKHGPAFDIRVVNERMNETSETNKSKTKTKQKNNRDWKPCRRDLQ